MSVTVEEKRFAAKIVRRLARTYPKATCSLRFQNPLQLLVATILSAQCTDRRVNLVTEDLFARFQTAADYAFCRLDTLEKAIESTGFFRNKAKHIQGACRILVEKHDSKVPVDFDALVALPGIGRKTANVIMGTAFGISSGVVVDTHVGRISRRTGLSGEKHPVKVERDLMARLPRGEWIDFSHRVILLGRGPCKARKPTCDICPLSEICPKILT